MCNHGRRLPRKLQLLAFRQVVKNSSDAKCCNDLEFINKIPLLRNYFANVKFIVSTHFRITRRGFCATMVEILKGSDLFNHITKNLSCKKFEINFWCLKCNSFCSLCDDKLFETDMYKYTHQLADCKRCNEL